LLAPEDVGFEPVTEGHWHKTIRGREIAFRELRTLDELAIAERLQREVMSFSETDTAAASFLVIVPDTGGFVIGAFDGEREIGVSVAWGGYKEPEPFLYSDLLVVVPEARSLGIGFELKRLQALRAAHLGFQAVLWTVDPLRAANARLNFERLGALAVRYARDKYGAGLGAGLYGGMPTDRIVVRWPVWTERTRSRLIGDYVPRPDGSLDQLPVVSEEAIGAPQLVVPIPGDIDRLVKDDFDEAMRYRLDARFQIELAIESGYVISGAARSGSGSLLLAEPVAMFEE
jgi:predicted GNAT superfamily acetyltransferase